MVTIAPPTPELMEKIKWASPPPRFPRGYFSPLITPTRQLLDRALTISQAADVLIQHGALEPKAKRHFIQAMPGKISRLRRQKVAEGGLYQWRENPFYESTHLVLDGERKAVCGSRGAVWNEERSESNRCCRCVGLARKHGIAGHAVG